jgi:hypothetical protein
MRRHELMKPDKFSEVLLVLTGGTMAFFLIYTFVFALLRH